MIMIMIMIMIRIMIMITIICKSQSSLCGMERKSEEEGLRTEDGKGISDIINDLVI